MAASERNGGEQDGIIRAVVRAYGSALPLGFFCFGIGMLLLGAIAVGWVAGNDVHVAGFFLAAFVFPLEFLTCIIAFLARDGATASTLGLFSTSWLAFGLDDLLTSPATVSAAEGVFLIGFTVMIAMLAGTTFSTKPLLGLLLMISSLRSLLDGIYQFGGPHALSVASGVDAIVIFAAAAYLGLAFLLEDTKQRAVLPTLRRGAAEQAIEGDLGQQLARVQDEAGVRRQL
jgi:succinate-acetate transporter protein